MLAPAKAPVARAMATGMRRKGRVALRIRQLTTSPKIKITEVMIAAPKREWKRSVRQSEFDDLIQRMEIRVRELQNIDRIRIRGR